MKKAKERILEIIDQDISVMEHLKGSAESIAKSAEMIANCFKKGGKLILFGNGGSAADAQHIAAEFVGRYSRDRDALPALALVTNNSAVTAIGNDYGFDHVFERQVQAVCTEKDVVIGISTSGNSKNVILGIKAARKKGSVTVCMTGSSKGELSRIVDMAIEVPSRSTPRVQENHILIGHILTELVEDVLLEPLSD